MSDAARGPGWWQASDRRWYPPELHPSAQAAATRTAAGGIGPGGLEEYERPLPSFWGGDASGAGTRAPGLTLPPAGFTATAYGTGVLSSSPLRRPRPLGPWIAAALGLGAIAVVIVLFTGQNRGPDPHRSPASVVVDYLNKLYGANPSAAAVDVAPGQSTDINGSGTQTLSVVVTRTVRKGTTASVSVLACLDLAHGRCSTAVSGSRTATIGAVKVHGVWFVDERTFPDCDTADDALVCAD